MLNIFVTKKAVLSGLACSLTVVAGGGFARQLLTPLSVLLELRIFYMNSYVGSSSGPDRSGPSDFEPFYLQVLRLS